jgi:hypothetical protein
VTKKQLEAIREQIAAGVARAAEELRRSHTADAELRVGRTGICVLCDFPIEAVCEHSDISATVMLGFRGTFWGTALLAMDPHQALAWIRSGESQGDPIDVFLHLGQTVLEEALVSLAEGFRSHVEIGDASLEEQSVVATLLATHAPPDTAIVSADLAIQCTGRMLDASLFVLLDRKLLLTLLRNLASQSS